MRNALAQWYVSLDPPNGAEPRVSFGRYTFTFDPAILSSDINFDYLYERYRDDPVIVALLHELSGR